MEFLLVPVHGKKKFVFIMFESGTFYTLYYDSRLNCSVFFKYENTALPFIK